MRGIAPANHSSSVCASYPGEGYELRSVRTIGVSM